MKATRRYDIDWLRVIAIALLLIYHIAIVFQPWASFIGFVRSENSLEDLWIPMTMLNVWRIPFLFFVSGMGMFFAMRKRNWKQLIKERSRRILLPFLFGIIAITPIHMYIFQVFYRLPTSYYPHQGHLWFLGNIFVYVLLFLPAFYLLKHREVGWLKIITDKIMENPLGPLSVSLFFMLEGFLVKPQVFAIYAETWHGFFVGALAFFFGYLFVYSGSSFWNTVKKWKWAYLILALSLYGIRFFKFQMEAPSYLMALESICWILSLFGIGYHYLNKPSTALSYLSQAAYPVYIIHMALLYVSSLWILKIDMSPFLKFLAITASTFVLCFIVYELFIIRLGVLRLLFGLKSK